MGEVYIGVRKICKRLKIGKQLFYRLVAAGLQAKKIAGVWTLHEDNLQKFFKDYEGGVYVSDSKTDPPDTGTQ